MSAYRQPPRQAGLAPRTPWRRLLRAWATGTFARLPVAHACRGWELRRRRLGYTHTQFDAFGMTRAEVTRLATMSSPEMALRWLARLVGNRTLDEYLHIGLATVAVCELVLLTTAIANGLVLLVAE